MATRRKFLHSSAAAPRPCLLALGALQTGKPLGWDAEARKSKAL
jgi:hypothetical protein